MKLRIALLIALSLTLSAYAQKKVEKPKVHADFEFGSYPLSRTAMELTHSDEAKWILVGLHEGWEIDKLARNFKVVETDLSRVSDRLEDERLISRTEDYGIRPALPVIRERDLDRVKDSLQRQALEFSKVLQSHWPEIEAMVLSLDGSKSMPKERVMYEAVVSGILFGGMLDAFYDDKTLMPPPPRRGKNGNEHYYAWLVESNPAAAGKIKRELRDSDNFRIISVGSELPEEKLNVDDLRGKATVYDEADAIKYRRFIGVFTRDKLLPYFKSHRTEFQAEGVQMSSGHYVAFAEVFAWFYNVIANGVVDDLIASHRIAAPAKYYTYAIRVPQ